MEKENKNILEKIPSPVFVWIGGLVFLITWPFILIGHAIYSLFSSKLNDSKKVSILKETVTIFILLSLIFLLFWISSLFFGDKP